MLKHSKIIFATFETWISVILQSSTKQPRPTSQQNRSRTDACQQVSKHAPQPRYAASCTCVAWALRNRGTTFAALAVFVFLALPIPPSFAEHNIMYWVATLHLCMSPKWMSWLPHWARLAQSLNLSRTSTPLITIIFNTDIFDHVDKQGMGIESDSRQAFTILNTDIFDQV